MTERRIQRYNDFSKFFDSAKDIFETCAKADVRSSRFSDFYSLCIVPGGRNGGHDKRLVQVFYGNRPFDEITELKADASQARIVRSTRFLTEHGACLHYQCDDSGRVTCILFPAGTENMSTKEEAIIIGVISDPASLIKQSITTKHWRCFASYMQCTSLDGDPSWSDHLRVAWIRFTRPQIVDGKVAKRSIVKNAQDILKFSMTVGLSGFLLAFVTAFFSAPPRSTNVNIVGEAENIRSDRLMLAQKLGDVTKELGSLESRVQDIRSRLDEPIKTKSEVAKKTSRSH